MITNTHNYTGNNKHREKTMTSLLDWRQIKRKKKINKYKKPTSKYKHLKPPGCKGQVLALPRISQLPGANRYVLHMIYTYSIQRHY